MKECLSIAQITSYMSHMPIGGMETVVYHLSRELSARGHKVTVIASSRSSADREESDGIEVVYVPSFEINSRMIIPKNLALINQLLHNSDIVHLHSPHGSFALSVGFLAKMQKKPIVTSVLSHFDMLKHPGVLAKLGAFPIEGAASMLIRVSSVAHAKNVYDYSKLSRLNKRVCYIPDGVPESYFSVKKNTEQFYRKFDVKGKKAILYVGRLHPLKGPQILIRSLKYVLERVPEALVVIVGPDAGYGDRLRRITSDLGLEKHVLFAGTLTEEEKLGAYDCADVVVIPSRSDVVEAFSLVASEAWARGKPVVATAVGALKYRVKDGENGYLAKPNDPVDLARKILEAQNMQIKSIPSDVCSWNDVAGKFVKVYESLVPS